MKHNKRPPTLVMAKPAPSMTAPCLVLVSSWRNSLLASSTSCFSKCRASSMMPPTSDVMLVSALRKVSGIGSPPARRLGKQKTDAEADQHRLNRVTADKGGQVVGHVAEAVLLEVLAPGLKVVGDG